MFIRSCTFSGRIVTKFDDVQVIMTNGGVIPGLRPGFTRCRNAWM
jgi:hypothetical protein